MFGKASILPVIKDHVNTLYSYDGGLDAHDDKANAKTKGPEIRIRDLLFFFGSPLLIGAGAAFMLRIQLENVGELVAGASILAGFSFGLAIFVFELRMSLTKGGHVPKGDQVESHIDELFSNVAYSIIAGLFLVIAAIICNVYAALPEEPQFLGAGTWWTFALTSLAFHYLLTMFMCIKRLRWAYKSFTR